MSTENTVETNRRDEKLPARSLSLAEIDTKQDDVLQRLDELNEQILELTEAFRTSLDDEKSSNSAPAPG